MMRKIFIPVLLLCGIAFLSGSCKEEKESQDIITRKTAVKTIPSGVRAMSEYTWKNVLEWSGSSYTVSIHRFADKSLPEVKDESGNRYYDNRISLEIVRADSSIFFKRVFSKSDFREFTDNDYGRNGALLGLAFDRIDGGSLCFGASVGSPDTMSDEYVPLTVVVSGKGDVRIVKDTQLDTGNTYR